MILYSWYHLLQDKLRIIRSEGASTQKIRSTSRTILHFSFRSGMDARTHDRRQQVTAVEFLQYTRQSHLFKVLSIIDQQ